MSEKQIFSKILRLDKYIYNELIVLDGALQRGIAIFLAVTTLTTLSAFRLFNSLIEFLESNLVLFSGEMSDEEFADYLDKCAQNLDAKVDLEAQKYVEASKRILQLIDDNKKLARLSQPVFQVGLTR